MKILWFSSTPCSATKILMPNHNRGGWLASLESELSTKECISLHISFYYHQEMKPFKLNQTWFYPVKKKAGNSKFKIVRYLSRLLKYPYRDNSDIKELIKIVTNVKPDIIHITGTEDNFGLIQYHTNIPIVISIQGILNPIREKFFAGIPIRQIAKFDSINGRILLTSFLTNYHYFNNSSIREKNILKKCKYIIGRTDWDKRVTRVLAPDSQYFIGNEILRDVFYENKWNKEKFNNSIQLVTIINGALYKGLETIVKTALLLTENQITDFEWNVIGISETSSIASLVKKWLKINYKSIHINLMGSKNEQELAEILLNSDIYCQVSHIENSPNSLCEAMLVGMPVIATFAGGTASLLIDKKEGILVQEGEPYSYAGAIAELANNFELAKEYAENARLKAQQRHDKQQIVNGLMSSYKTILNNHKLL